MNTFPFFNNAYSLFQLFQLDTRLAYLIWQIKKSKKTYLSYPKLLSLVKSFYLVRNMTSAPVQIAEFGVGHGGSAQVLAYLVDKYCGHLALFDLFGLIPPPTAIDGLKAHQRYHQIAHTEDKLNYYGNIPNLLSVVKNDLSMIVDIEKVEFIVGKYEEILPNLTDNHCYHLVHIDCDWYASTYTVLEYLKERLHQSAIIQFDDYEFWLGTKKAVDETAWLQDLPRYIVDGALVVHLHKRENILS